MNLDLEVKIIWHLISNSKIWQKASFIKKYFRREIIKRLEACNWEETRSKIWKLAKAASPLINNYLSWKVGNGCIINIWNDTFLFKGPLRNLHDYKHLCQWMEVRGLSNVYDISL